MCRLEPNCYSFCGLLLTVAVKRTKTHSFSAPNHPRFLTFSCLSPQAVQAKAIAQDMSVHIIRILSMMSGRDVSFVRLSPTLFSPCVSSSVSFSFFLRRGVTKKGGGGGGRSGFGARCGRRLQASADTASRRSRRSALSQPHSPHSRNASVSDRRRWFSALGLAVPAIQAEPFSCASVGVVCDQTGARWARLRRSGRRRRSPARREPGGTREQPRIALRS